MSRAHEVNKDSSEYLRFKIKMLKSFFGGGEGQTEKLQQPLPLQTRKHISGFFMQPENFHRFAPLDETSSRVLCS